MFDEVEEITFDSQKNLSDRQAVPSDIQDGINTIVDKKRALGVKNETKEMIKGAVLGSVIGAILSLYRKKSVWLGVLAGGLAGGYLAKEEIINLSKSK